MTMGDFADFADQLFGRPQPSEVEKGVRLRGHKVNGVQYVRADDVAELLELNKVLPRTAKILRGGKP
jgi:hypothetical protein